MGGWVKRSCFLATILIALLASPLAAQQWPMRAIKIVTGTPAGGSPDFVSRLLADKPENLFQGAHP
jgi:tripartite-type tricarboxylate transporter receptor subunit TctC